VARELGASAESWPRRAPFTLFDELVRVYGTCVIPWSGVAVDSGEAELAARRMAAIVDGFGFDPVAYPRACWARWWADRWAERIVRAAREGQPSPPSGTMLHALVTGSGRELPVETAAVELLNILRPTVAVAWLGAFAVIELARSPEHGPALAEPGARTARWHFVDEVRRTAPFVPALAGRVRRDTTFRGHRLAQGDLVVLDVPGTNHRSWGDPGLFRPARFAERTPNAFEHVPQGGGDPREGHRCPGEPVAMTLLDRTLQAFAGMVFTISGGATSLRRIPASPAGRLVVTSVVQPGLSPA
jgi:fatty-acid peroxygenase